MNKQEIKTELKTLEATIKKLKGERKNKANTIPHRNSSQHQADRFGEQARGLLIAYAYLNGEPFTAPEKNPFNENDSDQQSAVIKAKAALGMTEVRVYPSMTVHKPLPDEQFDKWLTNTSGPGV